MAESCRWVSNVMISILLKEWFSYGRVSLKYDKYSGFNLSFWSAVVKIYLFATLCWVRKNENSPTNFPSPYDNIFLIVTENKCIAWNYHFWGPACIYLIEFSNINFRIRWKICLRLTLEVQEVVLVSLWLWIYLTHCSNVFLLTLKM